MVTYEPKSNVYYDSLTSVQQGVLFHTLCEQLTNSSEFSTIHSKDGGQTSSVMMSCDDNVQHNVMQITGWDSKQWSTPLTKATLRAYIDSVPADSWWTDKQTVVRRFYSTLISFYESSGGTWPITSFWDPWATSSYGVQKQDLPTPSKTYGAINYCIEVTSETYSDIIYRVTADDLTPKAGGC